ncbi:hypothetical protein VTK73DRAFT_7466 [Phialemonium thermophilum]|uniref:Histone-lysine N-methyltransferase, H3 lysine-36 specific n=1 Tax=Phialemonium thermophilum TaxID=223376 RepID=A0ABR3XS24_9PEZI
MATVKTEEGAYSPGPPVQGNDEGKPNGERLKKERSASSTPNGSQANLRSSSASPEAVKSGSESASTPSNNEVPKLASKTSQNANAPPRQLFKHLPDVTAESCETFQVINDCLYGSKHMGASEHDALDCDCAQDWRDGKNHACGEDSDCINRATKMECVDRDCNCGDGCQNQRFQRKQYADVSVIKTEKKGFGLRANTDLQPNDFIFEYIGEVINEPTFRRRMLQYDEEGIKHFYFMSLTKSEFVDATKKGNLGRFCNHSCRPNCYVDKWVVGEKLRMGIFASREIEAGEELVFNYNVDRYGAEPQPCYCGEPNCTGFIGGKTQTERATKLPISIIEALGIEDGDSWDTAVAKRPRKKKPAEDDEEYVNSLQPQSLHEDGVTKVMAALMQCKEKWIAVKLLGRIQNADDERVLHRVVRMHGYQILKTTLNAFVDDTNVVLQILDILYKLPRLTKNKISDSNIETTIETLAASEHEEVSFESKRLLDEWNKLETGYRIPRKKFDPSAPTTNSFEERRKMDREEEAPKPDPLANVAIPKGPRNNVPQRNANYYNGQRPRKPPPSHNLPAGWFVATDQSGAYYYYNKNGTTTWKRPTAPASDATKGPSRVQENQKALQHIIDSLTKEPTPKPSASLTPQPQVSTPVQETKKEKWRSLPLEKQMKIYENTLFPHVKYVMDRFRHKLPKEDLKKFAREVNKKLVASDYKNNRVEDPTSISEKQEKKVKHYVKDFFQRAVEKYDEHEKRKAERAARHVTEAPKTGDDAPVEPVTDVVSAEGPDAGQEDDVAMSDAEDLPSPPSTSSDHKRKREDLDAEAAVESPSDMPWAKRLKEDEAEAPSPPPPPPPPPPPEENGLNGTPLTEEEQSMREQEAALVRENEEAQRLEDEAEATKQQKVQDAALPRDTEDFAIQADLQQHFDPDVNTLSFKANGVGDSGGEGELVAKDRPNSATELEHDQARKQEVLSH